MKKKLSLNTWYCRGFQKIMKVGMNCVPWGTPKIMTGPGAVRKLPAAIKRRRLKRPLIVTGPTALQSHRLDGLLEAMKEVQLEYEIFNEMTADPTDEHVEAGVSVYRRKQCDCIIAFGGGSPMDCAKAMAARIARPSKTIRELQGLFKVLRPVPVIFAVPTTSGTGSETTIAAVITEAQTHHKVPINDLCLMPKYAVLDPELTVGMPPRVTAESGMDALSHAVEAYINHTYNTKTEDEMCRKAVKLIYENLFQAYQDGGNLKVRQNMQKAAFYAGRVFTRGCVGYVHAIGHTLGGLYGVTHGQAMGILLPHVLRAYGQAAEERLAELCDVCGLADIDGLDGQVTVKEKAERFIHWIEEIKCLVGIPVYPDMVNEQDVDQIAQWAVEEANPLYPTPVVWSKKDVKEFMLGLME